MSAPETPPENTISAPQAEPGDADEAPDAGARASRTSSEAAPRGRRKPRRERVDAMPARGARVKETTKVSTAVLAKGLEQTIQGIAIAVTVIDPEDGAIIARGEPRLTAALITTAEQNPRFKKRLEELLQGGTYMQLAVAVGAIALPITMRHVPMPPAFRAAAAMAQMDGTVTPDAPPAEWAMPGAAPVAQFVAPDGTVLVPGVAYEDASGRWMIDDAGTVIELHGDEAA